MPVTLPLPPFKRNNAGRLVSAFEKAFQQDNGTFRQAWANTFSVPQDDDELLVTGLGAMHVLLTSVTSEIENSELPSKHLFPQHSKQIRRSLFTTNFEEPWANRRNDIKHEGALAVLRVYAAMLPEENEVQIQELNEIEAAVNELFGMVNSSDLDQNLKVWILDLLKSISLGIKNYWIYGAVSLRDSSSFALGEMLKHQQYWGKEQAKTSSWWTSPLGKIVSRIVTTADSALAGLKKLQGHYQTAKWFLTFVPGDGSGSDAEPPPGAPSE